MAFDPNDFNDLADLVAYRQRKQILDKLNELNNSKSTTKNHVCPWCGGQLAGNFEKCQNCSSDVAWVAGQPCKPENLIRQQKHEERRQKYLNTKSRCCDCKSEFLIKELEESRCSNCARKIIKNEEKYQKKFNRIGCLILFIILTTPMLYFGSHRIIKGMPKFLDLDLGSSIILSIISISIIGFFSYISESIIFTLALIPILVIIWSILLGH
jgi:hypothetical protein